MNNTRESDQEPAITADDILSEVVVHPHAGAFRLMTPDELDELAESIKTNGQRQPIIVDQHGQLIDGRNRYVACALIGIEPVYEMYDFADDAAIASYIVDTNITRRHISAGQRAMGIAFIYPDGNSGGRGRFDPATDAVSASVVSARRIQAARQVLWHSREEAEQVRTGGTTLDEALKKVIASRQTAHVVETRVAELRAKAPDLADHVDEERMTLDDALVVHRERLVRAREAFDAGLIAAKQSPQDWIANVQLIRNAAELVDNGTINSKEIIAALTHEKIQNVISATNSLVDLFNRIHGEDVRHGQ